jgi:oligopeptide/dipeptide ABC transporter ATP-binding protein
MAETISEPRSVLYELNGVSKEFGSRTKIFGVNTASVQALDDVNLEIYTGESLGLVGESGSGKTTLGRLLVGFERPTQGQISMEGVDVGSLRGRELRAFRHRVQMIYQNPFSSLNPRRSIRDALSSGSLIRKTPRGAARERALAALLQQVGLDGSMLDRYPHEFSGGQRQRIVIARALSVGPTVLIADEPVSALDVSIQSQVLNLLMSLKRDLGFTVMMITHDLRVAHFFCDRIAILYRGRLVELGGRSVISDRSLHPYTRMLMSAAPSGDPTARVARPWVRGEIDFREPHRNSCIFSGRCWLREQLGRPDRCTNERPVLRTLGASHGVACHFAEEVESHALHIEPRAPHAQEASLGRTSGREQVDGPSR